MGKYLKVKVKVHHAGCVCLLQVKAAPQTEPLLTIIDDPPEISTCINGLFCIYLF